jgi:hypothetical protein
MAWMHAEQSRPSQAHLTLGTIRRSLKTDNTSSLKTIVRHMSHDVLPDTLPASRTYWYPTFAVSLPVVASARLHHLNLGCAARMA